MKVLLIDDHPLILAAMQAVIGGLGRRHRRDRGAERRASARLSARRG